VGDRLRSFLTSRIWLVPIVLELEDPAWRLTGGGPCVITCEGGAAPRGSAILPNRCNQVIDPAVYVFKLKRDLSHFGQV
jgi:hypothetical protein